MRKWLFLVLLLSFASCKDLASQKEVRQVLSEHAQDCGIDLNSLQWAQSTGKDSLDETRSVFMKKFEAVKKLLQEKNIRWEFKMEPAMEARCQLKREIILASPGVLGFVENIHWALKSLVVQEDLKVAVKKIRVIVTALKGISLYEANRSVMARVEANGDRVLDFYVNLGDPYAGISFSTLLKNFTDREVVYRGSKLFKAVPQTSVAR